MALFGPSDVYFDYVGASATVAATPYIVGHRAAAEKFLLYRVGISNISIGGVSLADLLCEYSDSIHRQFETLLEAMKVERDRQLRPLTVFPEGRKYRIDQTW